MEAHPNLIFSAGSGSTDHDELVSTNRATHPVSRLHAFRLGNLEQPVQSFRHIGSNTLPNPPQTPRTTHPDSQPQLQSTVARVFTYFTRQIGALVKTENTSPILPPPLPQSPSFLRRLKNAAVPPGADIIMLDDEDGSVMDEEEEIVVDKEDKIVEDGGHETVEDDEIVEDEEQEVENEGEELIENTRSRSLSLEYEDIPAAMPPLSFPLIRIGSDDERENPPTAENLTKMEYDGFIPTTCPADTIDDDPLLIAYSLCVNNTYKILICLSCRILVKPSSIRTHLSRTHKCKKLPKDLVAMFKEKYDLIDTIPIITQNILPVFGLRTLKRMMVCSKCSHGYSTAKSFNDHLYHDHKGEKHPFYLSPVQRFTSSQNSPYFPVVVPYLLEDGPRSDFEILLSQDCNTDISSEPMEFTQDFHLLSRFLTKSRWTEVVNGLVPKFVRQFVGPVTGDEGNFEDLSIFTQAWLAGCQRLVQEQSNQILKAFSSYTG